jgi:hypothetical protein
VLAVLAAAANQYDEQVRITTLAVRQAERQAVRGPRVVSRLIATYQARSVELSIASAPDVLSEQGIPTTTSGERVAEASLLTAPAQSAVMLDQADTNAAFSRIVAALVNDASRTAALADMGRREAVTGYVRSLNPPSCSRCAILAGRVYRYSQGFQRHPRCDCLMTPTNQAIGPSLITDPQEAYDKGWVRGLSSKDREAVDAGADLGRVVNVRRKAAGLNVGSSVATRAGRLTPEGCAIYSSDHEDFVRLLRKFGYLTP